MWLTSLKIAIIEKNTNNLDKLMEDIPSLSEQEDIQQAIYLLREASELVHTLKDEAAVSMKKIEKNIKFLRSTETSTSTSTKLDIRL